MCLIPAFNEEKTIAKVIADAFDTCGEVVVCDDGSTDATSKIAESQGCEVMRHTRNLGKGAALRTLFQEAIKLRADIAITIDADGQHDAREIPKVIEPIEKGEADLVIGSRKGLSRYRMIGNSILNLPSPTLDTQSGFRAYRGDILKDLIPSEMGMGVDSEILSEALSKNYRIHQVPISNRDEGDVHTHNSAFHFLDVAFTTFKLATFRHPLGTFGVFGIFFIFASLFFGIRSYGESLKGIGNFSFAITLALFSIYLMLIGLISSAVGLMIWVITSLVRRIER